MIIVYAFFYTCELQSSESIILYIGFERRGAAVGIRMLYIYYIRRVFDVWTHNNNNDEYYHRVT